ncbi:MAG: tRNA (adenosine(37)-N6)-dimethylallyltransferase MiaA, partial [Bacteroidota bacterium]|nr:tRNA (adenosine(37)-N6)-dimethylallyltransferase MiaA [Bacteroidota bacterium]
TVVVIAGPTAVGKTSIAIQVAKHFETEIISADSRQCFKELNIGVARPSSEELSAVPHYFIASNSIQDKINAASFEEFAMEKANVLFQKHAVIIMVGGSGMYIKSFCEGLDEIPEVSTSIHEEVINGYKQNGNAWLREQIQNMDPKFLDKGEMQNPQRIMRALEVIKATGKSIFDFRKAEKKRRDFNIIKIALDLPKPHLHNNISHRVDKMIKEGLLDEARPLITSSHLNALQTVGYKEVFQYFRDEISLPAAIEAIKQNTKQYAKRQLTWFKKDKNFQWIAPDAKAIIQAVNHEIL